MIICPITYRYCYVVHGVMMMVRKMSVIVDIADRVIPSREVMVHVAAAVVVVVVVAVFGFSRSGFDAIGTVAFA